MIRFFILKFVRSSDTVVCVLTAKNDFDFGVNSVFPISILYFTEFSKVV